MQAGSALAILPADSCQTKLPPLDRLPQSLLNLSTFWATFSSAFSCFLVVVLLLQHLLTFLDHGGLAEALTFGLTLAAHCLEVAPPV